MTFSNLAPLEVAKCKRIDDVRDGERGEGRVGEWKRKEAGGRKKSNHADDCSVCDGTSGRPSGRSWPEGSLIERVCACVRA